MVCSGDTSDKLQPSELTDNLHPPKSQTMIETPRFPFLVTLQVLIEVFANGNPHSLAFEGPIRITE